MSRTDWAFFIGIYAGTISTLGTLWVLWSGVFLDRARIIVDVREAAAMPAPKGKRLLVGRSEPIAKRHIEAGHRYTQILWITVKNRGRRPAQIVQVARAASPHHETYADFHDQVPFDLPPGHGYSLVNGAEGGYQWETIPLKRFYVLDGAGQIHPLRERYHQRFEKLWRRSGERPTQPLE